MFSCRTPQRWERMGAGGHLDDWLAYYPGLAIRRTLAMRLAHTNSPVGKRYADAFRELMKADGLDANHSLSAVLWLGEDPERMRILRELRDAMTPGQRSRLNSPIAARQKVERILKACPGGTEDTVRVSPVGLLKKQITEQAIQIAKLEAKLAKQAEGQFDIKRDNADNIAAAIIGNISEYKAEAIATGIATRLKKMRQKQKKQTKRKPAG